MSFENQINPAFPLPPPAHELPLPAPYAGDGGVRLLLGVPYAPTRGIRALELDVALPPSGNAPFPVVVFLHDAGARGRLRGNGPNGGVLA